MKLHNWSSSINYTIGALLGLVIECHPKKLNIVDIIINAKLLRFDTVIHLTKKISPILSILATVFVTATASNLFIDTGGNLAAPSLLRYTGSSHTRFRTLSRAHLTVRYRWRPLEVWWCWIGLKKVLQRHSGAAVKLLVKFSLSSSRQNLRTCFLKSSFLLETPQITRALGRFFADFRSVWPGTIQPKTMLCNIGRVSPNYSCLMANRE